MEYRNTIRSIARWGMAPALALVALGAGPAMAHHSFRAYDMTKSVTISATIKEFRWGAPHSSMVVIYRDANGRDAPMSIVSGSPLSFSKQGFSPRDFKRGDKIKVSYHPNTNGSPGGALAGLTLADGRSFSDNEASAARPGSK